MKMGTYAVVKSGVVVNVIVWDGVAEWTPPDGCEMIESDEVGVGWAWDGNTFSRPPSVEASGSGE